MRQLMTTDGGSGTNTVICPGNHGDWTITDNENRTFTFTDGTDTHEIENVRFAQFDDETVDLSITRMQKIPVFEAAVTFV